MRTSAEPVVLDLETGTTATIAREGAPIAWSKDELSLLVRTTSGSFVVAADGSGGQETSVLLDEFCPGGAAGKVVAKSRDQDVVVYDIAADSSIIVEEAEWDSNEECTTTIDGRWAYHRFQLFDIEKATRGALQVRTTDEDVAAVNQFGWRVPALTWKVRN
jgi:hypothetical protein